MENSRRAVGGSQNLGGQYRLAFFGQYDHSQQISTRRKIIYQNSLGLPNTFSRVFRRNS